MKVSFLMTVYNAEDSINEVIGSILNQSYSDLELIIINDGSTDNSSEIIKKYMNNDNRIIFVDREVNKGRVYSLNEGLAKCNSEYIFINDSDDISSLDRVEKVMDYYNNLSNNEKKNLGLIGGSGILKDITKLEYKECKYKRGFLLGNSNGKISKLKIYSINPFIHSSIMYKKSALNKIEGFPTEVTSSIDYFTIVKISKYFYIHGITDIITTRLITGNNFFMQKKITEKNKKNVETIKSWIKNEITLGLFYNKFSNFLSKAIEMKNKIK
ncbi:glycosyltransferase family 2 protein [Clostridium perfringens]